MDLILALSNFLDKVFKFGPTVVRSPDGSTDFVNPKPTDSTAPTVNTSVGLSTNPGAGNVPHNLLDRPLLEPAWNPRVVLPTFTDVGTVAKIPRNDDTAPLDAAIMKDIPGATQFFAALGFDINSQNNAAGLSPQELNYVKGTSASWAAVTGTSGVAPTATQQNDTIARLNAVEGKDGSKQIFVDGEYTRVGGGYNNDGLNRDGIYDPSILDPELLNDTSPPIMPASEPGPVLVPSPFDACSAPTTVYTSLPIGGSLTPEEFVKLISQDADTTPQQTMNAPPEPVPVPNAPNPVVIRDFRGTNKNWVEAQDLGE